MPNDGPAYIVAPAGATVRVTVSRDDPVSIAGRTTTESGRVVFRPSFPFDAGRMYFVHVTRGDSTTIHQFVIAIGARGPIARVAAIAPDADSVPENLLRIYIHFTEPMSRESGVEHIHLLDDAGREVEHAFLPLDGDFWNPAHTRYTLFFDPGRVKRGILPNEQLGRPMRAGRMYTLVVDSTWRDANGQPLTTTYRRTLRAGAAVMSPIKLSAWQVQAPRAGTRDELTITFDRLMDSGLLDRAISIWKDGKPLLNGTRTTFDPRRWSYIPQKPWEPGDYQIVALSVLEDVAGNRIDHPFEVDMFTQVDSTSAPERYTLPLKIRK